MRIALSISLIAEGKNRESPNLLTDLSWWRRRQQVKKRDGAICQYCGEKAEKGHVDHVVPLSKGGTDDFDNLKWTCRSCNLSKGADTLDDWTWRLLMQDRKPPTFLDTWHRAEFGLEWDSEALADLKNMEGADDHGAYDPD